jgi:hypothetical protein
MAKAPKKPKTPKVKLGKPLEWTDEMLDEMAQVTPADIAQAQAFWRNNAPERFKTLLDAQTVNPEKKKGKP